MAHYRRRHTRFQSRPYQGDESLAAQRDRLQPCNRQRPSRRLRRHKSARHQLIEDMLDQQCPNPGCVPRRLGWWTKWARDWPYCLRLAGGTRTDIVKCRGCGIVVPRINERQGATGG